jgi:serine protease Do
VKEPYFLALFLLLATVACPLLGADALPDVIEEAQTRIVKIYGAGGFRGLQAYQSGMLISPDGHVLTVFSYVLDTDYVTAVTHDGRRFDAKFLGADPRLEIALLKIDATDLPHFKLSEAVEASAGTRVVALSNLFGVAVGNEAASAQRGTIAAQTSLQARRGQFETAYRGPVYVLDATTNNPGAAGGALLTVRGQLLGILGKELRNAQNHTWLNYALPIAEIEASVAQIEAGAFTPALDKVDATKPELAYSLELLGIRLVPDVLDRTPPFVESVREGSPAARAGIRPDDLVLLLNDQLIQSCAALREELEYIDIDGEVQLTLLRGDDVPELSEVVLKAAPEDSVNLP